MEIRRCPLCGAGCFDDIDTCYCCMHRFDEDGACDSAQMEEPQVEDCAEPSFMPNDGGSQMREVTTGSEDGEILRHKGCSDVLGALDCEGTPEGGEEPFEVPIVEAAHWFSAAEETSATREGTNADEGQASLRVFAFGPAIETLPEVGECLRLDIPFSALRRAASAVRASQCTATAAI